MFELVMPSGTPLRFELKAIGAGTFGAVYPGTFRDTEVAVKLVRCSLELVSCLRHETSVVLSLQHPHIIPVLETMVQVHEALAVSVHVMPRAQHSIQRMLELRLSMQPRRCASEILSALEHMHAAGWVHSDVTTMNILVMPGDGRHVLADFGVTCARGTPRAANTVTNEACRAPECHADGPAVCASDVWSLACVVAEMLCGVPIMFYTLLSGSLAHKLALADTFRAGCVTLTDDPALRELFVRCFQPDPALRCSASDALVILS
jgi:serine/threonine protein kinase